MKPGEKACASVAATHKCSAVPRSLDSKNHGKNAQEAVFLLYTCSADCTVHDKNYAAAIGIHV